MKRVTFEEFVERAKGIHGDKYVYCKENFVNMITPMDIFCRKHGFFKQTPSDHVQGKGQGCKSCAIEAITGKPKLTLRKKIKGVGVLDVDFSRTYDKETKKAYHVWTAILYRCYTQNRTPDYASYEGCYICEEWKLFSNFLKWFNENYVEGYAIDKDILCKGNKCYCPEYCCFVPQEINELVIKCDARRGKYPLGVEKKGNKFRARIKKNNTHVTIGYFDTPEQAFAAYKEAKEKHIQEMATQYFNESKITKKVYDALMKYEVEITD
jgi:hypothetical protein